MISIRIKKKKKRKSKKQKIIKRSLEINAVWYCEEEDKELYLAQHCQMLLEARMLDIHRTAYSDSAGSVVTRETTVSRMTE